MIYLASPYSHPERDIRRQRFELAAKATAQLIKKGYIVYSPIVHTHLLTEQDPELPTNFEFWKNQDLAFIDRAEEVWVLMLFGYDKSIGVNNEVEYAKTHNKPVRYIPFPLPEVL